MPGVFVMANKFVLIGCLCHGATFCPDLECIGYEDDVPIFVRKESLDKQREYAKLQVKIVEDWTVHNPLELPEEVEVIDSFLSKD